MLGVFLPSLSECVDVETRVVPGHVVLHPAVYSLQPHSAVPFQKCNQIEFSAVISHTTKTRGQFYAPLQLFPQTSSGKAPGLVLL